MNLDISPEKIHKWQTTHEKRLKSLVIRKTASEDHIEVPF